MKPLHVGLLVVGAALAGGLAVKMTQPPSLPAAAAMSLAPAPAPVAPAREKGPTPVVPQVTAQTTAETEPPSTAAPPPVYQEPPPVERSSGRRKPFAETPKPTETPKAEAVASLRPEPYQAPASLPQTESQPEHAQPEHAQPEHAQPEAPPQAAPTQQPAPEPRRVMLRAGMAVPVRLNQTLSTDRVTAGDTFQASLSEPLVVDGFVIAERGARISGRVVDARKAGRLTGTSSLELALVSVQTADGQKVTISTQPWLKRADGSNNADAAKIGGGAALGAILGAIAGGGAGAAIGASMGGGAGVGAAAATGARPVTISTESLIRFRLAANVTITERQM